MRKRIQKSTRRYNKPEGSAYSSDGKSEGRSKPRFPKEDGDGRERKSFSDRGDKPFKPRGKSFDKPSGERSAPRFAKRDDGDTGSYREKKSFGDRSDRSFKPRGKSFDKPSGERGAPRFAKRDDSDAGSYRGKKSFDDRGDRPFKPRGKSFDKPPYKQRGEEERGSYKGKKSFDDRGDRPFKPRGKSFDKPTGERGAPRFAKRDDGDTGNYREKKSFGDRSDRPFKPRGKSFDKPTGERGAPRFAKRDDGDAGSYRGKKSFDDRGDRPFKPRGKSFDKPEGDRKSFRGDAKPFRRDTKQFKSFGKNAFSKSSAKKDEEVVYDGTSRLNKYVANSGICSRREADDLITAGLVSVNGEIITKLGTKVNQGDIVRYNGETIRNEALRYVLLNKPKDFITTTDDPQNRRTVMELIDKACKERVYPVGRLDRNTTGVLLFTNDGDLAKKLTHPGSEVQKIYHVELDKKLTADDLETIRNGIDLEDGFAKVDSVEYDTEFADKAQIGVELHSGKNRIVRRIFESLGYEVAKLDRVIFAGLTKKDLPRGRWRLLSDLEVSNLKMMTGKMKQGMKEEGDKPKKKKYFKKTETPKDSLEE